MSDPAILLGSRVGGRGRPPDPPKARALGVEEAFTEGHRARGRVQDGMAASVASF